LIWFFCSKGIVDDELLMIIAIIWLMEIRIGAFLFRYNAHIAQGLTFNIAKFSEFI